MVAVFHSTFYAAHHGGGSFIYATSFLYLGVPIFFVISGYCIAAAAESCATKGQSAVTYFGRRFRRIYPPYWAAFVLLGVLVGAVDLAIPQFFVDDVHPIPRPWWLGWWPLLGNLTLTETWRPHVIGSPGQFFLGHAWTLCYEEQFYAVLGVIVAISPKRLFAIAAGVTAIVAALVATGQAAQFKGFFFDGLWLQFAAGILVHSAVNHGRKYWALGILAAALAWQWHQPAMATAFGFALLLVLMHPFDRPFAESRWTLPITWCGTMCYSLYLVHWPLCKAISHAAWLLGFQSEAATMLTTVPLCLTASIAGGYAFHVLVERRFLNAPLAAKPEPMPVVSSIASPAQASPAQASPAQASPAQA